PVRRARCCTCQVGSALRGAPVPASGHRLVLPVRVVGTEIGVVAIVRRRDGTFTPLSLGRADGSRLERLVTVLPPAVRGGKLVAVPLVPPPPPIEHAGGQGAPAARAVLLAPARAGRQ